MVTNKDLNRNEYRYLLPEIYRMLRWRKGKGNAIKNREIQYKLIERINTTQQNIRINGIVIRRIINYIRKTGMIQGLIGSQNGYYIASDITELERYCKSLAKRANEIYEVKQSILNQKV